MGSSRCSKSWSVYTAVKASMPRKADNTLMFSGRILPTSTIRNNYFYSKMFSPVKQAASIQQLLQVDRNDQHHLSERYDHSSSASLHPNLPQLSLVLRQEVCKVITMMVTHALNRMNHAPLAASEVRLHTEELRAASFLFSRQKAKPTWKIVRRKYMTLSMLEAFSQRETDIQQSSPLPSPVVCFCPAPVPGLWVCTGSSFTTCYYFKQT